jgi:hypothetical protein
VTETRVGNAASICKHFFLRWWITTKTKRPPVVVPVLSLYDNRDSVVMLDANELKNQLQRRMSHNISIGSVFHIKSILFLNKKKKKKKKKTSDIKVESLHTNAACLEAV